VADQEPIVVAVFQAAEEVALYLDHIQQQVEVAVQRGTAATICQAVQAVVLVKEIPQLVMAILQQ
jgi:hypothetical protein